MFLCTAISWIILAVFVGSMGESRKIGGFGAFFLSLFFSPIIGILFVLASDKKPEKKKIDSQARRLFNSAVKNLRRKNTDAALSELREAISVEPNFPHAHYNLACVHSLQNNASEAFIHLQKAVELGYDNFRGLQSDPHLEFLRRQPNYQSFVSAGYKLSQAQQLDVYDQLAKLGQLKEKGLLTNEEFEAEKKKLLS